MSFEVVAESTMMNSRNIHFSVIITYFYTRYLFLYLLFIFVFDIILFRSNTQFLEHPMNRTEQVLCNVCVA